ncbi:hypothetical protein GALMADRAFT_407772 [Galerina marginata CBS 339.88]|uniref:Uncharacterized protein n=1 Tax=Galerina marginata (strain CBS 339.88) TaxID=685588 RepID=A0A067TF11_GALM3|nr:hypothetical protein GALMADRAFT_407772 [Galerina marginata CBS 339.88]
MFAIVPVLVIMSACSFSLLLIVLYRRIRVDIKKEKQATMNKDLEQCGVPGLVPESSNQGPPGILFPPGLVPPCSHCQGILNSQSKRSSSDFTRVGTVE